LSGNPKKGSSSVPKAPFKIQKLVLDMGRNLSYETRRRVVEVARLLGCRRRPSVGSAPEHRLRQVGMVVKARPHDQPHANPFYGPVMAAVEEACRRQRINLLYATVPVDADNHLQALPRMLLEDELDGLLSIGAFVDATITQLMERRPTPTVLVDAYSDSCGPGPDAAGAAERNGGRIMRVPAARAFAVCERDHLSNAVGSSSPMTAYRRPFSSQAHARLHRRLSSF
jgi:DNA-binding LacI/PurR family transcriptional regulator